MKKILAVVHQERSNPGLVGQLLRAGGYAIELCCPAIGHALPEQMDEYAGAIVFGGPMSANDDESLPYIRTELDWIPSVLEAQKPYLGICLGAQLLARVLGATVAPRPDEIREAGYVPIQPTPHDDNPLKQLTHVFQWHKEGFEIPQNAVLLAKGELFPNQAFQYGDTAHGLQFHPEVTRDIINLWHAKAVELNQSIAPPYHEQIKQHDRYADSVESWLKDFLLDWLNSTESKLQRQLSV